MSGNGPADLGDLAQELLDAAVDALETIPDAVPGLLGAPDRVFISPHLPALDCCDQLTVHVPNISEAITEPAGLAAGTRYRSARINHIGLVVTITRCVPVIENGHLPSINALGDASEQLMADGWALWNHIFNLQRAGLLFSYCGEVFWDGMRPIGPEGGCAGWTLSFRVLLDGYEEADLGGS